MAKLDIASLIGFILGIAMFLLGVGTSSEAGMGAIGGFWSFSSVLITIFGSMAGVLASYSVEDFLKGVKGFAKAFKVPKVNVGEVIKNIIDLSNIARKEGLLALEEAANGIEDEFLKKGVMLVVDGTDPELVRGILETDLTCIETRHNKVITFWRRWAELGPAWGMIGTLIGLINMLSTMSDPSSVGPNMATALITTLYGSLLANWLCTPVANKLSANNDMEIMVKEITVEGLLSIQAGENPRVIEEKLKSFLSPKMREGMSEEKAGGEA